MRQEKVWDEISPEWARFRREVIPEVVEFLKRVEVLRSGRGFGWERRILDLGCGSGRNFVRGGEVWGVDFSSQMLGFAREKAFEIGVNCHLVKSKVSELEFDDNFFDAGIFIATLHCVENVEGRKKSLKEFFRVLKLNGRGLISVWSKNHRVVRGKSKDSKIGWTVKGKKLERYYYIFEKEELLELLKSAGFEIVDVWGEENIFVEVAKK